MLPSGSDDGTVKLWNTNTGDCVSTLSGHMDPVWSVCFSPCGTKIVSGGGLEKLDGGNGVSIRIWDAETGNQIGSPLNGHSHSCTCTFDEDGDLEEAGPTCPLTGHTLG